MLFWLRQQLHVSEMEKSLYIYNKNCRQIYAAFWKCKVKGLNVTTDSYVCTNLIKINKFKYYDSRFNILKCICNIHLII